jgi:hypothetical protein
MKNLSALIAFIFLTACTNIQNRQSAITEQLVMASTPTSLSETPTVTQTATQTETPTFTRTPTQIETPTSTVTPSPTFLPLAGWVNPQFIKAISLQYPFPPNFWSVGRHKTKLEIDCAGSYSSFDTNWTEFINVKEDAPILEEVVQFRIGGVKTISEKDKRNVIAINPGQPTVATIDVLFESNDDVDRFMKSCKFTFSWDDHEPVVLIAGPLLKR